MPVILSICSARFVLHRRLTLFALRLPFQMRVHWLDAHLLFSDATSICNKMADDELLQRFVVCQESGFASEGQSQLGCAVSWFLANLGRIIQELNTARTCRKL